MCFRRFCSIITDIGPVETVQLKGEHGVRNRKKLDIEDQLYLYQIFGIIVMAVLCLVLTIFVTVGRSNRQQTDTLFREAAAIAKAKPVVEALESPEDTDSSAYLRNYLDIYIKSIKDLDFVAVCDLNNTCLYYPNGAFVGRVLSFGGEDRVLSGAEPYLVTVARSGYDLEMIYAPVRNRAGQLLGYVTLSVFQRSTSADIQHLLALFIAISFSTLLLGIFIAVSIRRRTQKVLRGRRVEEYRRLMDERNEVLNALEEAIVAINLKGEVIMMNKAFLKMVGRSEQLTQYDGALKDIFPETVLLKVLETGTAQYNWSTRIRGEDYVASTIPVYENGKLIGAASITRNVTEVRRLGQQLSETNQMVDTLRSFSHEFNNKLHVILGYLEQQDSAEAKNFIINDIGGAYGNISKVTKEIESNGIAAIIIGKMTEASRRGIKLDLQADSFCQELTEGVSFDCYVTVLGNLLQNAIDELGKSGSKVKEISLGLSINADYSILTVTDTGCGMPADIRAHLFEKGVTTKGSEHGRGLFLVKEQIDKYHGTIDVDTEPGEGTSITVSFHRLHAQEESLCTE